MNSLKNCSNAYKVSVGSGAALFKTAVLLIAPACLLFASSCSDAAEMVYKEGASKIADSVSAYIPQIATDTINGVTHNFIRKADIKFRVKNVLKSTTDIEEVVTGAGGYITQSELSSNKDYSTRVLFKKDSLIEQTYYTATSHLTLRIPNKLLDSVVNRITCMAVFVDHRRLTADDVKLKLYANRLAENRYKQFKQRIQEKTDTKRAKLNHITQAEENALGKQTQADIKSVESYDLADQVNYSTVTLALYQDQNIIVSVLPAPNIIEPYQPSFAYKAGQAFLNGFEILKNLALFLINIWSLIVILFALFFTVKKLIAYFNKKSVTIPQAQLK